MTCSIVGDSIAAGIAAVLHGCSSMATVGASGDAIARYQYRPADYVIVSLGSNPTHQLNNRMDEVRARAPQARFIWIVPASGAKTPGAAVTVRTYANMHGDSAVAFVPGREGVHPKSYTALSRDVLARMR